MATDVASVPPALDGLHVLPGHRTVEQFFPADPSDSNIELLDGPVYVSPAPGLPHARLVKRIERWLDAQLAESQVLSPLSTAREDVRVKVPMYREAGITCWIVDADRRRNTASGDCIVDGRAAERHLFG